MSVKSVFKNIFTLGFARKFGKYVAKAYPIVELIAMATPTKLDDEIIAVANKLGVKAALDGTKSTGEVIRDIAVQEAQRKLPGVPKEIVERAVEAAYQQMKAKNVAK
jgi:hypothetical protein